MTTVVLCGSLGSSSAMWDGQRPALDGAEVVAVDHPGHGGAPVEPVVSIDDLARRVLRRVDGRFSFVGLSLGGAVGIRLALDEPDRVERLVLACALPRFGEPEQWLERAQLVRSEGLAAIVDAVLARWFTAAFDDVERFREMFLATDAEGYARCCDALALWDARAELAGVRAPTLVVAGADDPTAPPAAVAELAAGIPDARFVVLDDAAHLAAAERAAEFNELLREHL
jgi:3-oxoadipate enol-lactonase